MKYWLIFLVGSCFATALPASENLICNGNFKQDLNGFQSISTRNPVNRVQQTVSIVCNEESAGKNALKLKLSPETAQEVIMVQSLPLKKMQAFGKFQLKCKVRFESIPGQEHDGNVFIRVRQWKDGNFLKNSAGHWLPFTTKEGLRGVLQNHLEARTLIQAKEYCGKWYDLTAAAEIDDLATSTDLMITATTTTKGTTTIYITDLVLQKPDEIPFVLIQRPSFITTSQETLPLQLQINTPGTIKAILRQKGKILNKKEQYLEKGNQEMQIPLKHIDSGNLELTLSISEYQEILTLAAEEDSFAE